MENQSNAVGNCKETRKHAAHGCCAWSRITFFTGFFFWRMVAHGRCVFNGLSKKVPRQDSGLASIQNQQIMKDDAAHCSQGEAVYDDL